MGLPGRLDPEVAAVLDAVPSLDLADIPRARVERERLAAAGRARWTPSGRVHTADVMVPGFAGDPPVRVRVHRPTARSTGAVLLWVHGGGHVLGSADQDDPLLDRLVARTGCVALAVDWRRAPEHPYPAALHDCYAVLAAVAAGIPGVDGDPGRVVVGGASSGGGVAAGLALLARDRGEYGLAGQLLIYPMLDDRELTVSSRTVTDHRVWNHVSNRIGWAAYLGGLTADDVPAYAAPARAADVSRLPPTWIATAELDLFRDEDIGYAARLYEAGVPTELHVYPGAVHGFDLFAPEAGVSRRFVRDRDEAADRLLRD
ncbi:alpha/beta hydrolase [Blastococcus sp. PRF04-17]|uniref:alpha/beta hydrolase n=1 Tax=Blastococcus sp. PRF04-17 TaxID=2933797 RepID=UPI001FF141E5|nr:alpha/beta hydrolase [Blastococcus sp. PRF04-17]UOY01770.1 alpha/beta hydrolase [Blastococcus sp. PRF04-17]